MVNLEYKDNELIIYNINNSIIGSIIIEDNCIKEINIDSNYYILDILIEVLNYYYIELNNSIIYLDSNLYNSSDIYNLLGFKLSNNKYELSKRDFLIEYFRINDLYISRNIDKEDYIKHISNDYIINITGESGSGKSTLCLEYINNDNYIVIDTDILYKSNDGGKYYKELREYFINKYNMLPDIINEFDIFYKGTLDYFKKYSKWLVIDSAQYRNMKDITLLKGEIIIKRTCINNCYNRCIERYMRNNKSFSDIIEYRNRKKNIFKWYHSLNSFINKVDRL